MIELTSSEIAAYYRTRIPAMAQPEKREWRGRCPVHNGTGPNFSVHPETGFAHCHSQCGRGWDVAGLEMALSGSDFAAAKAAVYSIIGRPAPSRDDADIEASYDYTDETGRLVYQVVRKHGKKFVQRRPDGAGGWIWNLKGTNPVPYQLPELVASSFIANRPKLLFQLGKAASSHRWMPLVDPASNHVEDGFRLWRKQGGFGRVALREQRSLPFLVRKIEGFRSHRACSGAFCRGESFWLWLWLWYRLWLW
jgi:CHC2 zinc finger